MIIKEEKERPDDVNTKIRDTNMENIHIQRDKKKMIKNE